MTKPLVIETRSIDDAALQQADAELRSLLARPDVPEEVLSACLSLSECQHKLFLSMPNGYRTGDWSKLVDDAGTFNRDGWPLRLEPSNLLRELIAALRAFEWPKVLILIEGGLHV
jgi:hypothetical protein